MDINTIKDMYDGSISNISLIESELDKLSLNDKIGILKLIATKIAHQGTLCISGIDSIELAKGIYKGYLQVEEYNELIPKSICPAYYIEEMLNDLDFNVEISRINNYRYYIEARRN